MRYDPPDNKPVKNRVDDLLEEFDEALDDLLEFIKKDKQRLNSMETSSLRRKSSTMNRRVKAWK